MARRIKHRPNFPTVAIVGEGKVEKIYFEQLRLHESIDFAVKPNLPKNSSIEAIVDRGFDLLKAEFDTVFCVFDMDKILRDKTIYQQYQKLKKAHEKKVRLIFIENNPCIEYWFLLHFEDSTRYFNTDAQLLSQLRKYIPDYNKSVQYLNRKGIYKLLKAQQAQAREYASKPTREGDKVSGSAMYQILDHLGVP